MVTAPSSGTTLFSDQQLRRVIAIARETYPLEACGLFVGSSWEGVRLAELDNIQDALHARDPQRHPRTARTAYAMHPLRLSEAVDDGGGLLCIWHSHCDVGAYFSDEDIRVALGGGTEPLWPGVLYLVVSCRADGVDDLQLFSWDGNTGRFIGHTVPLPSA